MVLRKTVRNALELYGKLKLLQRFLGLNDLVVIVAESNERDEQTSGRNVLGELQHRIRMAGCWV